MTLRTYAPLRTSRGTTWPPEVRRTIEARDRGCVGALVGMPAECFGALEIDHVRASGAIGMKSRSTADNGCRLCSTHHRVKTLAGKRWRPVLIEYIERVSDPHAFHVDPCADPACPAGRPQMGAIT
jgi:hypothetical protein